MMKPLLFIAALASALWLSPISPALAQDEILHTDLTTLLDDYGGDKLAAQRQYEGRKIRMTVEPRRISRDSEGNPQISVRDEKFFDRDNLLLFHACFEKSARDDVLKVIEMMINEKPVTIVCTVKGLDEFVLTIDHCAVD